MYVCRRIHSQARSYICTSVDCSKRCVYTHTHAFDLCIELAKINLPPTNIATLRNLI